MFTGLPLVFGEIIHWFRIGDKDNDNTISATEYANAISVQDQIWKDFAAGWKVEDWMTEGHLEFSEFFANIRQGIYFTQLI